MIGHRPTSFLKHAAYIIKSLRRSYTQPSPPVELQSHFRRGGRNLSERFRKLEKTLLGKHGLSQTTIDASQTLAPIAPITPSLQQRPIVNTFRGLVIPEVPKAPEPDECCMSGCAICVHDLYQEALDNYNTSVTAVRASLTAMKVPVEEWPETVRPESQKRTSLPTSGVSLSAFQEMERALKARREAQAQIIDVHIDHLENVPTRRRRRRRWSWKGLELGALYESVRWILYSNK